MNISAKGAAIVAMVGLAACGSERAPFTDILADRFDAPACRDAQILRMGGYKVAEGHKVSREYMANEDCLCEIEIEIAALDFSSEGVGTYVAQRERAWRETVIIDRTVTGTEGNIKWEEINP